MIIGGGLLGSSFSKSSGNYKNIVVFASGVSNSKGVKEADFAREKDLVVKTIKSHKELTFIYFSSILAGICDNQYYNHKLEIEKLIAHQTDNYLIFRIPQIVGGSGNKNTLFNYLKNSIKNDQIITIYKDVKRSLIDIDDLVNIVNYCKNAAHEKIIYIAAIEKIDVLELANKIGSALKKHPLVKTQTSNENNNWDQKNSPIVEEALQFLGIEKLGYTDKIIEKYTKY